MTAKAPFFKPAPSGGPAPSPSVPGATQLQVHIGAVPPDLADLMRGFGNKAAWEGTKVMDAVVEQKEQKDKEHKLMSNRIDDVNLMDPPDPAVDETRIRAFNQSEVADIKSGTNKSKLHAFMDDLRQALNKNDDQMHLFWRYQAKTIHDTVMLKEGVRRIEIDFDKAWKAFVPNYGYNIEQAAECIRLNCKGRNSTAANLTLLQLMTLDKVRLYFLQLVRTFAFDADVAAMKHAPTIDDKLKMNQMRADVLNWFLQYK